MNVVNVCAHGPRYIGPRERHQDEGKTSMVTACTRTRNEHSEEVLFDIDIVTKTKHLDDEMRSSTREVERPGGVLL